MSEEHLVHRVQTLEANLREYAHSTNEKLDLLLDLSRQMAAMQERQARHSDDLERVDKRFEAYDQNFNASFQRVHHRLDELTQLVDKRLDVFEDKGDTKLREIKSGHDTLRKEYDAKVNFFSGVWRVIAIVSIALWGIAGKFANDLQKELTDNVALNKRLEARVVELERKGDNATYSAIPRVR